MKFVKSLTTITTACLVIFITGCISQEQYDVAMSQNRTQQQRILDLDSELNSATLKVSELEKQLEVLENTSAASGSAKDAEIKALKKDIEEKKALVERIRAQLLRGGVQLPAELNIALQELAGSSDMIAFDEETGILKFKSDFLFKSGSAQVNAAAEASIKTLASILNSDAGSKFDVVIAGYTDNDPIKHSVAQHPTNWHLSSHRAIGVLKKLTGNNVESKRLSARGFGEFRPIESNDTKEGKAANRRVEIYIVPQGA